MIRELIKMALDEKYKPFTIFAITAVFCQFLTIIFYNSTFGYSLYAGYIFFMTIMFINRKTNKQNQNKKSVCSGE